MTGIVDWAASRARMVVAFIALSILAGAFAYTLLPKEGEPASVPAALRQSQVDRDPSRKATHSGPISS